MGEIFFCRLVRRYWALRELLEINSGNSYATKRGPGEVGEASVNKLCVPTTMPTSLAFWRGCPHIVRSDTAGLQMRHHPCHMYCALKYLFMPCFLVTRLNTDILFYIQCQCLIYPIPTSYPYVEYIYVDILFSTWNSIRVFCNPVSTPMLKSGKADFDCPIEDNNKSIIGSLLYITKAFTAIRLSQYPNNPSLIHMGALKRVIRYHKHGTLLTRWRKFPKIDVARVLWKLTTQAGLR